MQFKAGYIVDSIAKVITDFKAKLDKNIPDDQIQLDQINGLLQYVCSFDVDFPHNYNPDFRNINPVLATLNNIITRGLPTRAPLLLEDLFVEIGLTKKSIDVSEINYPSLANPISYETVFELLHIIEPQLEINRTNYGGNLGSNLEWEFIEIHTFLIQILQSQRDFSTINAKLEGGKTVDFCFTSPYLHWNAENNRHERTGIIFEVDGPYHSLSEYKYYDAYRDALAEDENFETIRFTEETIKADNTDFESLIGRKIYQIFKRNFERNINEYLAEYSLLFIPLAVARVQKTIIEYLIVHPEIFKKEKIKIAIVERDLPCGAIAVRSLQELFYNINAILEGKDKLLLPEISLTIFENAKWVIDKKLHLGEKVQDENFFQQNEFDIIIDHSILRRSNIYTESDFQNDKAIKIRSSHYYDTSFGKSRRVYCANLLNYKSFVEKKDDGSYFLISKYESHINYFIQNIFRKVGFREGQLPIISRALQQKPVIGLLPTGGGKSLTYQLSAFLQPGLCIIVDPIKSLMQDQVRVLRQDWIDCCEFINSNLRKEEKIKKLVDFRYGETMFLFISPERFVMQDFRKIISTIHVSRFGLAFSYCVIDEVHCVSEWGHDFRSTYLMLGKNAQQFAKTRSGKPITLIGLTATASFDVLADVERELQIQHSDIANAIIMIENTIRPELFFRVIDSTGKVRIGCLNDDFSKLGANLQKLNNPELIEKSKKHHKENFNDAEVFNDNILFSSEKDESINLSEKNHNDFYAIIFCPVKGRMGSVIGVDYVYQNLNSISKGYFYSSDDDDKVSKEVQTHFENFIYGKTKHIVCTKAFGMGIDKKDIRSTYHFFYSSSLESLVQEAGRAGRDRKISEANIIVSTQKVFRFSNKCLGYSNPDEINPYPIENVYNRRTLRKLINQDFNSKEEAIETLKATINRLTIWSNGNLIPLPEDGKSSLRKRIESFLTENYSDRDIHNYFFESNFKGIDVEYSQIYSLFNDREFEISEKLIELNAEFNSLFDKEYVFKYWSTTNLKRLYVSDIDDTEYGFINLNIPLSEPSNPDFKLILNFLKDKNNGNEDIYNLISERVITELNEGTLKEVFESAETGTFNFIITSEKIFIDNNEAIFSKISQMANQNEIQGRLKNEIDNKLNNKIPFDNLCTKANEYVTILFRWFSVKKGSSVIEELREAYNSNDSARFLKIVYLTQIEKSRKLSTGFIDFLLLLEENIKDLRFTFNNNNVERWLKFYYHRSRYYKPTNDTGRLIYRMHSMGLLEDYLIDYNKNNLYYCTFRKYDSIDVYINIIENYLRRYLSENSVTKSIADLKSSLGKPTLVEDIMQCLYFLSKFSYKEIASKRKRATDEIENILNSSLSEQNYASDWFQQNLYLKEQIYFYFNAKYARIGFKINGKPFSLLDDYQEELMSKHEILDKYLDVYQLEGTEQNNYKHMIGSCKKILRSLSETDLNNEWVLRLLKAFAMYSVNNTSYISEANAELELGFNNLYKDESFQENKFEIIEDILKNYFGKLKNNIRDNNETIKIIETIHVKLLLKKQNLIIENLINRNKELKKEEYYA